MPADEEPLRVPPAIVSLGKVLGKDLPHINRKVQALAASLKARPKGKRKN